VKHCRHVVEFYGTDEDRIVRNVTKYLMDSLRSGGAAIAVASAAHCTAIGEAIARDEKTGPTAFGERLLLLDAAATLKDLLHDGRLDAQRAELTFAPLLSDLSERYGRLHIYGEMVGCLWRQRAFDAASVLEQIWNQLLKRFDFDLYCGYPIDVLSDDFQIPALRAVLSAHGRLVPTLGEGFDAALRRAIGEMLGEHPNSLGALASGSFKTLKTALPCAEGMILKLRSALPRYADEILAKAKEYA
jgi:hypothetical protein